MSDIYEQKAKFVKELQAFYIDKVGLTGGLKRLDYGKNEISESVHVTYNTGGQKCFFVGGLNNRGILIEFSRYIDHFDDYRWLNPDEALYRSEFLEDE